MAATLTPVPGATATAVAPAASSVSRRFNRRRCDAARTIEAFSARLCEQVDLDTLTGELLAVTDHPVEPTTSSLWLRPSTGEPSGP